MSTVIHVLYMSVHRCSSVSFRSSIPMREGPVSYVSVSYQALAWRHPSTPTTDQVSTYCRPPLFTNILPGISSDVLCLVPSLFTPKIGVPGPSYFCLYQISASGARSLLHIRCQDPRCHSYSWVSINRCRPREYPNSSHFVHFKFPPASVFISSKTGVLRRVLTSRFLAIHSRPSPHRSNMTTRPVLVRGRPTYIVVLPTTAWDDTR
ncbi:hypothetical protein F5B20DRAFT_462305 [Whalleya microplaca]|nr:hypothetical protein F5B20DRAFT_462305 [Whalleya microplaca]